VAASCDRTAIPREIPRARSWFLPAAFAALTAIFVKIGVENVNLAFATR